MIEALTTAVRTCPRLEQVTVLAGLMSKRIEAACVFVQECQERGVKVWFQGEEEG